MEDIYSRLNTEQRRAVTQTEGPVLILAGAGSGKTRVITHRVAYLMQECGVDPWNILAITFTNKAAGEMRHRVDELIGFGAESVWISTFHSLCVRILRRHIDLLGYDRSFSIYDTDDQKRLMKDVMKKCRVDPKILRERTVLSVISSAKNAMKGPQRFRREDTGSEYIMEQIADCYDEYQKELRRNNALDFDDLLLLAVQLFRDHPEVLRNYQNRFRYIMVDEYQDTNIVQFELVKMLAGDRRNLCVVGDDDQSIYKFRGADIRNILQFEQRFPDAMVVKLEQNYRSTQTILDAANAVIRNNTQRKDKALRTDKGKGAALRFRQFESPQEEAYYIVSDIVRRRQEDRSLHNRDFAVLYRTNAQSRLLEEQFVRASIPYNVVGGTNFYDRREIRDILSYLKTIDNGQDSIAVKRIINVPRRGIGATTIARVDAYAGAGNLSFMEALEQADAIPAIGKAKGKLESFTEMIHEFRAFSAANLPDALLRHVLEVLDYEEELRRSDEDDAEDRIANIKELLVKMTDYQEHAEEPTLSGFLEDVALVADIDTVPDSDDRVLLMTLHSAKGLEFPYVYMAGMEDGVFPSRMSLDSDDRYAVEEERRLAYVGITRAQEELTLTASSSRFVNGEFRYNPVSRFISEVPGELFDGALPYKKSYDFYADDDWEDEADPFDSRRPAAASRRTAAAGPGAYAGAAGAARGAEKAGAASSRPRPKAVYVRPHTADDKKPFISRMGGASSRPSARTAGLKKGMPAVTEPDYGVGDRVRHIKFGEGTVLGIEKGPRDYKVTVRFDEYGQKVMFAAFAKLLKV
ncbi:MAG: UvrD-helicase domain-containing protein [Lachnospiraceae bacterium]|nr:UvrD-helicase domain-containing protein [Lachnospiraceae bacterium]